MDYQLLKTFQRCQMTIGEKNQLHSVVVCMTRAYAAAELQLPLISGCVAQTQPWRAALAHDPSARCWMTVLDTRSRSLQQKCILHCSKVNRYTCTSFYWPFSRLHAFTSGPQRSPMTLVNMVREAHLYVSLSPHGSTNIYTQYTLKTFKEYTQQ